MSRHRVIWWGREWDTYCDEGPIRDVIAAGIAAGTLTEGRCKCGSEGGVVWVNAHPGPGWREVRAAIEALLPEEARPWKREGT